MSNIKIEFRNGNIHCVYIAYSKEEANNYIKRLFKSGHKSVKINGKIFYEGVRDE